MTKRSRSWLRSRTSPTKNVLSAHKILFEAIYPWAGQDRLTTLPNHAVVKGDVQFAHPKDIRAAIDHALRHGQDRAFMAAKPGEIVGYLAYGHPFLDGNGRTIMVIHAVLAHRAGFSIDWAATAKTDYLNALTKEIDAPHQGHLDTYLKPFIRTPLADDLLADGIKRTPGPDGADLEANKVLGRTSEPDVKTRYEQLQIRRRRT